MVTSRRKYRHQLYLRLYPNPIPDPNPNRRNAPTATADSNLFKLAFSYPLCSRNYVSKVWGRVQMQGRAGLRGGSRTWWNVGQICRPMQGYLTNLHLWAVSCRLHGSARRSYGVDLKIYIAGLYCTTVYMRIAVLSTDLHGYHTEFADLYMDLWGCIQI